MDRDELGQDAHHTTTRQRYPDRDFQALAIAFVDDRQQPHPAAVVERLRERAAVAGGEDVGVRGGERRVHRDAVVDGKARRTSKLLPYGMHAAQAARFK